MAQEHDVQMRVEEFRKELDDAATKHRGFRRFDSGLHQALVIGAALAGFASLGVGLYFKDAALAGVIGAIPSVATILSQQLHCVKARNWHERMATEAEGIRLQLNYELKATPTLDDVAALSKQWRAIKSKMIEEWEKTTSSQPTKLENIKAT